MLSFASNDILTVVIAASFAAGLNVYATVATLGLLSHAHAFQLPPALHPAGIMAGNPDLCRAFWN